MTDFDATESAYKNGYNDGYAKGQLDALESTKIYIDKIYLDSKINLAYICGRCGEKEFQYGVPFDMAEFCKRYCGKEWINDGTV